MANTTLDIRWNKHALGKAIGTAPETLEAVTEATNRILSNAQSMSSGFIFSRVHWKSPK